MVDRVRVGCWRVVQGARGISECLRRAGNRASETMQRGDIYRRN